jgi:phosphosulfolactate phosphohydrolase-like enzyme
MLIDRLSSKHKLDVKLNDAGSLARLLYRSSRTAIKQSIAQGEHGRYLAKIGFAHDIETAADIDSIPVVPVRRDGRLVLEKPSDNN